MKTSKQRDLICMRLADMNLVHPEQIEDKCSRCGEVVGIFPSGQRVLAQFGDDIVIVCQVCRTKGPRYDISYLAPGAEHEHMQTMPKKRN